MSSNSIVCLCILILSLLKVDLRSQSNLNWVQQVFDTPYNNSVKYISVDSEEKLFVAGGFIDTADLYPTAGDANLINDSSEDIYLAKYTNDLDIISAMSIGGGDTDTYSTA